MRIHIDGDAIIAQLDAHGWTQNAWTDDNGHICAHQAIRLCAPEPGDAFLIEQVAKQQGWGTAWNDTTTETEVRDRLGRGVDVSDEDLAETFGPQWRAVVRLVRRAATLTADETDRLTVAWDYALNPAWGAGRNTAWDAAWRATRDAAWDAAWGARDTALAIVTWDLATDDGPYTTTHRDLLIGPWLTIDPGIVDDLVEVAA